MLDGIDVSHWQTRTPPLTGLEFAFARATYGTSPDNRYGMHVTAFRRAGLIVGAYHFGVGFVDPAAQARTFYSVARNADIFVLDLERDTRQTMSRDQGRVFIRELRRLAPGKSILLYSSRGTWPGDLGQDANWVADYVGRPDRVGVRPRIPWAFWQYTSRPWDKNWFNGDLDALRRLAGKQVQDPPVVIRTEEPLAVVTIQPFAPRRFTSIVPELRRFTALAELPPIKGIYSATVDADVSIDGPGPHGSGFLRISSGGSTGKLILAREVRLEAAPPNPDVEAQIEQAVKAERARLQARINDLFI